MEIHYIDEFITLAEIGNYLEAADALYLSQSTLSRHIQSIENDLGVQLFNRTTRKVELNAFGKVFLPYARQIQALKADYQKALSEQIKDQNSNITIGTIPTMAQYHITDILSRFQNEHPDYNLNIVDADSSELEKMLREGSVDFAFVRTRDRSGTEFQTLPYFTDHIVAIFPRSHPLADSESVSLDQLKAESFLFLSKGSMMHTLAISACKAAGFYPHVAFTGHRAENIVDLVGRGMGIGLLTRQPLTYIDTSNVAIVDVIPQFTTSISLTYPSEQSLSPTARQFLKFYKSLGII
ncbi:MAG: LysR family transcriptional regulator [Eubacteriales bacterium]|nr:LysR family transcriptional regulator [Eubacteriales bacterium]